jgi:SAM-dependent methyltransferase
MVRDLPIDAEILDVGNGLGVQDPVIARGARARRLVVLNVTLAQLRAGRAPLEEAGARAVAGDACRMPFAPATFDGLISVEAAFHFFSRRRFFREAARVLRPGGVLTMSDVPVVRRPRTPAEVVAGVSQLRAWGVRSSSAVSAEAIADEARRAGFEDVEMELAGERVIAPALRAVRRRLDGADGLPRSYELAARIMVSRAELLWRRGIIDYLFLRARRGG